METETIRMPREQESDGGWRFRLDAVAPNGRAGVYVLAEDCEFGGEEIHRFRREFPGITEGMSEKRVRELCLGRTAIRRALIERHGIDPGWVPVGNLGMPSLPSGMSASLTHSTVDGVPIAAVALSVEPEILGIDLECILSPETARKLERRFAEQLPREARGPESITELFTLYETVVKIASQLGHPKPLPSQIELVERTAETWRARLNADRIEEISGLFLPAFPATQARLCYGWWERPN